MFNLDNADMHKPSFGGKKYAGKMKIDKVPERDVGK